MGPLPFVLAQSFLGGALEWLTAGVEMTLNFVRDWALGAFNSRVLGMITAAVVLFAIIARIRTGRQL